MTTAFILFRFLCFVLLLNVVLSSSATSAFWNIFSSSSCNKKNEIEDDYVIFDTDIDVCFNGADQLDHRSDSEAFKDENAIKYENVNTFDSLGYTRLSNACHNGHIKILNILLNAGADPLYGLEFKPQDALKDASECEISFALPLPCDYQAIQSIVDVDQQLSVLEGLSDVMKIKTAYLFGFDAALKVLKPALTDFSWPEDLIKEILDKKYFGIVKVFALANYISERAAGDAVRSAIRIGNSNFLKFLLEKRTDITPGNAGNALLIASQYEHFDCFKFLFEFRTDISALDVGIAVTMAAVRKYFDYVKLVLDQRKDISSQDAGLLLVISSRNGDIDSLQLLLDEHQNIIKSMDAENSIFEASMNHHVDCVKLLLERLENVSLSPEFANWTRDFLKSIEKNLGFSAPLAGRALKLASKNGHVSCVEMLIFERNDITATDAGDALKLASKNGHYECVKMFLSYRIDITATDAGEALKLASENGHDRCVRLLHYIREDISREFVQEARQIASDNGHRDCVNLLE